MRTTGAGDEDGLAEHARRWAMRPAGRVAIVLHLSRVKPPGPRPHHRRIAEALMEDVALAQDGSLHRLRNGDLALLCAAGSTPGGSADAAGLPGVLGRLLRADVPDPGSIVSIWPLATDAGQLLLYVRARREELVPDDAVQAGPAARAGSETERARDLDAALAGIAPAQLVRRRQTAVSIEPGHGLTPLYREATLSVAGLDEWGFWTGDGGGDPFLGRYLAGRLDARMLAMAAEALGRGGPLDAVADGCPLHLNLSAATVGSPAFAAFAAACVGAGATIGVELSLLEACADPDGVEAARDILARHGFALVLDGVTHMAMLTARIGALRPDILKLDWTPELAGIEARGLDAALRDVGLDRVVLHRAETEAALRWGRAHGIRRFQGRHVDAMLAATRLAACAHAPACTLRQCVDRAGSGTLAGRAGCGDPVRLNDASHDAATLAAATLAA